MNKIITAVLLFFFLNGTFATAFMPVSASELVENSWTTKTPVLQARFSLGVVAIDGKIYAIGGHYYDDYTVLPSTPPFCMHDTWYFEANEQYDPTTDKWSTLQSLAQTPPVSNFAITAYQGKIYCLFDSTVEVYDPATNEWSIKSYTLHSDCIQAHVVDGKILVRTISKLFMYDPDKNSWTEKTQIPYIDQSISIVSAVVDDRIFVFHTVESTSLEDLPNKVNVTIYDPETDKWSEGETHEIGIGGSVIIAGATTGVYAPTRIYVLEKQYDTPDLSNWVYDPVEDSWASAKSMPLDPRGFGVTVIDQKGSVTVIDQREFGVTVVDDVLYVIGGDVNAQYAPIGYQGTVSAPKTPNSPDQSNTNTPKPANPTNPSYLAYLIATISALACVVIATVLFFYTKRK